MEILLVLAALSVAFSNGANDNFKGFATVWGSDTLGYRQALILATLATVAGSIASLMLADALVQQFSGKGLVPDVIAGTPLFILSVAGGTAATVFLATRLGLPVSTTHALIGGLVGAGMAQSGGAIDFDKLASAFLMPLLLTPVVALFLGLLACRLIRLRPAGRDCACLLAPAQIQAAAANVMPLKRVSAATLVLASDEQCDRLETPLRFSVSRTMDRLHVLSAMAICFARSVNDTPKLAALLLAAQMLQATSFILIAAAMAVGGLLYARQVAQTMSLRVTRMDHAQGLAANLVTATLVLFASKFGLPVSTTHVSVGAIAGIGASANTLNWRALRHILLSWLATLPLAAGTAWFLGKIASGN